MNLTLTKATMSSREIAELTGKQHKNVLVDCDNLNESYSKMGLAEISAGVYYHPNTGKQQHREYRLTRMQTFDLMTGYNTELRIKVNRRWEELETKAKTIDFSNPNTVLQLVQNWADEQKKREIAEQQVRIKEEQLQLQGKVIEQNTPKVNYFDNVLQSESAYTTTQIAKELGITATSLNLRLRNLQIQYKQSGTWVLYQKYQNQGYTKTRTYTYNNNGETRTTMLTVWTEKGRLFIHSQIKSNTSERKKGVLA